MELQAGATIGGAIFVLANVLLFWVREWLKNKTWRKNGNELGAKVDEIKTTTLLFTHSLERINDNVGEINVSMAEVKTAVNTQSKQCSKTVTRFDKAMGDQNKELISLAKESGRRR